MTPQNAIVSSLALQYYKGECITEGYLLDLHMEVSF